jgi:hypothetical protein
MLAFSSSYNDHVCHMRLSTAFWVGPNSNCSNRNDFERPLGFSSSRRRSQGCVVRFQQGGALNTHRDTFCWYFRPLDGETQAILSKTKNSIILSKSQW